MNMALKEGVSDLNQYLKLPWNSEKREGLKEKETHWELKIIIKNSKISI